MSPKSIFTSKLGWLGIAVFLLGVAQDLTNVDWAKIFADHPTWAGVITSALGGVIFVLRLYTSRPATIVPAS
jgi:hypothetical protein